MRALLAPLLWLLAIGVALFVLWRVWRGRPAVLRGRWGPQFVRMVAVVLVVLGATDEDRAAPVPVKTGASAGRTDEELPPVVTREAVIRWLNWQQPRNTWTVFKQELTRLSHSARPTEAQREAVRQRLRYFGWEFRKVVEADLATKAGAEPTRPGLRDLTAALDEMGQSGIYDHWSLAYLWRHTAGLAAADPSSAAELYARLYRHARVTDTLIRARAQVKPLNVSPRAWMSKAGPKRQDVLAKQKWEAEVFAAARRLYASTDAGTWDRDGSALARVAKDSAPLTLLHAGKRQTFEAGSNVRLDRLDLFAAGERPVVLEHRWLGLLTLPAGRMLSVWELPDSLSPEGRATLAKAVADALEGGETAARRLEQALPLAHRLLREKLTAPPEARGAARLRLILSLFDDAVMPPPPPPAAALPASGPGGRLP
jgi:hypothetical protein